MAKYNLTQNFRGADGVLYRAGKNVEVPKAAKLQLPDDSKVEKPAANATTGSTTTPPNPAATTGGTDK